MGFPVPRREPRFSENVGISLQPSLPTDPVPPARPLRGSLAQPSCLTGREQRGEPWSLRTCELQCSPGGPLASPAVDAGPAGTHPSISLPTGHHAHCSCQQPEVNSATCVRIRKERGGGPPALRRLSVVMGLKVVLPSMLSHCPIFHFCHGLVLYLEHYSL